MNVYGTRFQARLLSNCMSLTHQREINNFIHHEKVEDPNAYSNYLLLMNLVRKLVYIEDSGI